jgi:hypothetical protein
MRERLGVVSLGLILVLGLAVAGCGSVTKHPIGDATSRLVGCEEMHEKPSSQFWQRSCARERALQRAGLVWARVGVSACIIAESGQHLCGLDAVTYCKRFPDNQPLNVCDPILIAYEERAGGTPEEWSEGTFLERVYKAVQKNAGGANQSTERQP